MKNKKNKKNIFWRKWQEAQANETDKTVMEKLLSNGIKKGTFYKHCGAEIGKIDFDYIKIYSEIFNISLNDLVAIS